MHGSGFFPVCMAICIKISFLRKRLITFATMKLCIPKDSFKWSHNEAFFFFCKWFVTVATLLVFFPNMCFHISYKMNAILERHTKQIVLELFFSRMWPQMNCKIFCVPERLVTYITLVRFFSSMSPQMVFKITFFFSLSYVTLVALIWFLTSV